MHSPCTVAAHTDYTAAWVLLLLLAFAPTPSTPSSPGAPSAPSAQSGRGPPTRHTTEPHLQAAPSVFLDLMFHAYVRATLGSPGVTLILRLAMSCHTIAVAPASLLKNSASAVKHAPLVKNKGNVTATTYFTDTLHLGAAAVRVPIRAAVPASVVGLHANQPLSNHDGVLCLGARSPLWVHWAGYSLSAWSLRLLSLAHLAAARAATCRTG
eukprot:CAMPEP_0177633090 /NCGR_PEP_ID=MMETSP0447-20121125/2648_1 /TAXON_ID=0 /ORGANISM="Stygamoeba regulata, Strain BSH-02190019" /LENGTH=210 /DNA_ID=CAMNT_0019134719 /DNA_START=48 /DNA_END=676 /DNA_ORIENTATION=+